MWWWSMSDVEHVRWLIIYKYVLNGDYGMILELNCENCDFDVETLIVELNHSGVGNWFRQLRWSPWI